MCTTENMIVTRDWQLARYLVHVYVPGRIVSPDIGYIIRYLRGTCGRLGFSGGII